MACGQKGSITLLARKLGIQLEQDRNPRKRIVDTYDYPDEKNKLLFQVVRYEPKAFKQRRSDGNGGWIWNLEGVRRVLFLLPELMATSLDELVFFPEGEKDIKAIRSLGLMATCNPGGAGKFTSDLKEPLKNRHVVIIADKDNPGRLHAEQVANLLHGFASDIKVIEMPGDIVKDAADWVASGGTRENLLSIIAAEPFWKPFNDTNLVEAIIFFVCRFVVLSKYQATLIAFWVLHTYALEFADATPYLNVNSAEKRSGKTRLLEVLELIVERPWFTGRVTAAVLTRKVDAECPTLLLDESDAAFKGDKEYSETLRALFNTGYRRSGKTSVCVGKRADIGYKDLSTFCPKAIAGIGKLPDTVADRSIPIVLKRRNSDEPVERFRRREAEKEVNNLRNQIIKWAVVYRGKIDPQLPVELDDRAADCLEPIFAIADDLGRDWPNKVRESAIRIMTGHSKPDDSLGIKLLEDIKVVFADDMQIATSDLIAVLKESEESPWGDMGQAFTSQRLASLLRPYDIHPTTVRIKEKTPKGYKREDFEDAWKRYLSSLPSSPSATSATPGSTRDQPNRETIRNIESEPTSNVADKPQSQVSFNVADVADNKGEHRGVDKPSIEKERRIDQSEQAQVWEKVI